MRKLDRSSSRLPAGSPSARALKKELVETRKKLAANEKKAEAIKGDYMPGMTLAIEDRCELMDLNHEHKGLEKASEAIAQQMKEAGIADPKDALGWAAVPFYSVNIPGIGAARALLGVEHHVDRETGEHKTGPVAGFWVETTNGHTGYVHTPDESGFALAVSPVPLLDVGHDPVLGGVEAELDVPGFGGVAVASTGRVEVTAESTGMGPGINLMVEHPKIQKKVAGHVEKFGDEYEDHVEKPMQNAGHKVMDKLRGR